MDEFYRGSIPWQKAEPKKATTSELDHVRLFETEGSRVSPDLRHWQQLETTIKLKVIKEACNADAQIRHRDLHFMFWRETFPGGTSDQTVCRVLVKVIMGQSYADATKKPEEAK